MAAITDPYSLSVRRNLLALLRAWEEDGEDDNFSKGDAAEELSAAIGPCTCLVLPHSRRCPVRMTRQAAADT